MRRQTDLNKLFLSASPLALFFPTIENEGAEGAAGGGGDAAAAASEGDGKTDAEKIDEARASEGEGSGDGQDDVDKGGADGSGEASAGDENNSDDGEGAGDGDGGGSDEETERVVPETADAYDFTISEDVGLKNEKGEAFQFDPNDPFIADMRAIAHADGMSQKGMTDVLNLYAKVQKASMEEMQKGAKDAHDAKLAEELGQLTYRDKDGAEIKGEDRVKAILTAIETAGGKELRAALVPAFVDAGAVRAIEKLVGLASEGKIGDGKGVAGTDLDGLTGEDALMHIRSKEK